MSKFVNFILKYLKMHTQNTNFNRLNVFYESYVKQIA